MKTYHQSTKSKILNYLTKTLMATIYFVLLAVIFPARWLQILFGGFILLGMLISIPVILFVGNAVTISPEGIEYRDLYRKVNVNWKGFSRIGDFFFREGMFIKSNYFLKVKIPPFPNWETYSSIGTYFFIPLSSFDENWRDSELGQQIKQYAPHLFEKEKSVQSA